MSAFCVLSLGYDDILMPMRSLRLREAGYAVIETFSLGEVLRRLKTGGLDLLLICHTVPLDQRAAIIEAVHLSRPELPFVCLAAEPVYADPERCPPACNTTPGFLIDVGNALAKVAGRRG